MPQRESSLELKVMTEDDITLAVEDEVKMEIYKRFLLVRTFSCCFAGLLILCSLTVVILGTHVESVRRNYEAVGTFSAWPTAFVITLALVMISVGMIGLIAVFLKNTKLIKVFLLASAISIILEFCVGILCCVYVEVAANSLANDLKFHVDLYGEEGQVKLTDAIDRMQKEFECCGYTKFTDWSQNEQYKCEDNSTSCLTPASCCVADGQLQYCIYTRSNITNTTSSDLNDCRGNIYPSGCRIAFRDWMESKIDLIGIGSLVALIPQVVVGVALHWYVLSSDIQKSLYTSDS